MLGIRREALWRLSGSGGHQLGVRHIDIRVVCRLSDHYCFWLNRGGIFLKSTPPKSVALPASETRDKIQ